MKKALTVKAMVFSPQFSNKGYRANSIAAFFVGSNNKGIIQFCQGRALVLSSEYKNRLTDFTKAYSQLPLWGLWKVVSSFDYLGVYYDDQADGASPRWNSNREMWFPLSCSLPSPTPHDLPSPQHKPCLWKRNGGLCLHCFSPTPHALLTQRSLLLLAPATPKTPPMVLSTPSVIATCASLTLTVTSSSLFELCSLPYTLC